MARHTRFSVGSDGSERLTSSLSSRGSRTGGRVDVQNRGPDPVWVGGDASVTDSDGLELVAGAVLSVQLDAGEDLFGRCAAAETSDVRVLEAGR